MTKAEEIDGEIKKATNEFAKQLIQKDIDILEIMELTGLTREEIKEIVS